MAGLEPVGFFSSKNESITPTNLTQSRSGYAQKDLTDGFSLNAELIRTIFREAKPLGHNENPESLNLGFLYYALVRSLRPKHVLVIGSGFGFNVVCLTLGSRTTTRGA